MEAYFIFINNKLWAVTISKVQDVLSTFDVRSQNNLETL